MFSMNPFIESSAYISVFVMKVYIILMIFLVFAGTVFDVIHKGSAKYFFHAWKTNRESKALAKGNIISILMHTIIEALVSGEFCNWRRRACHLLTMYGFIAYTISTILMIFLYSNTPQGVPIVVPVLWYVGAFSVCIGGYWFWFFVRVDVVAEGKSRFQFVQADLFILLTIVSVTLGLIWGSTAEINAVWTRILFTLYLFFTALLFGTVPWSKFSHMFYKPVASFQKHMSEEDDSRDNLPTPSNYPESLGSVRRIPRNY
tara:strand:- start:793 stop:1569 length:777 start_codon:yes stop_codon:yes gene_type:complete